jgi:hypothetical protein
MHGRSNLELTVHEVTDQNKNIDRIITAAIPIYLYNSNHINSNQLSIKPITMVIHDVNQYSKNNRSVVSRVCLANIFLPENGRITETCSILNK